MRFLPIREINIFCILTVCKCELDGLLKESGRPFDGNWTVYWRKLDGLLTETGLILTESGLYVDGKWTFFWQKLDGLSTETGWSIDGNWTVFLWKPSSRFSSFWGSESAIFAEIWNPRFRGHLAFFKSFSAFLGARKCDFCRVVKPRVQGYQASCEQIFRILGAWKCDFWRFAKLTFQGPSQWLWKFSSFLRPENAILTSR